jgi:lipid-binding SYLF domain-containing protein
MDISRALDILYKAESIVPHHYFQDCYGVLILSAAEVGVLVSGTSGSGILMSHNPRNNSWSSPLCVNLSGVGLGFSIGSEEKEMIVFLHNREMIAKFAADVHLQLGSHTGHTWGRTNGEEHHSHTLHATRDGGFVEGQATSTFAFSHGHFYGVELEGAVLKSNHKRHEAFYGSAITPQRILLGSSPVRCNQRSGVQSLRSKLSQLASPELQQQQQQQNEEGNQPASPSWTRQGVAAMSAV